MRGRLLLGLWLYGPLFLAIAGPVLGQGEQGWATTVYLQEAFPKQTLTNQQIAEINRTFGADFDDWGDVHNLSFGFKALHQVAAGWQAGIEVDYSRGALEGETSVITEAGPATLAFEQRYSVFADLMAAAHWLPCRRCARVLPFVLSGAGVGYEKDTTSLTLRNESLDEGLRVANDGWFPVATAGLGLDVSLGSRRAWYAELGVAYFWGRLRHRVRASGSLAPTPEVVADTDSTGPNYWIGMGRRF